MSGLASSPPRAEKYATGSGRPSVGAPSRNEQREGGADRQRPVGRSREPDGREPGTVVAGADGEGDVGIGGEDRVHQLVDAGGAFHLVADAEAHVEHQRHLPRPREPDGVVDAAQHAPAHGDAAVRVVGDLEAEQLGAGRHAVEPADAVEVVARRDAGHVRAVPDGVEEEIERRDAARGRDVHRHRERRRPARLGPAEGVASVEVVVHRALPAERPVAVGVRHRDPAVAGLGDQHRERVLRRRRRR